MGNKVALITGSSRGLGRAIAIELAKSGYNVVINYNNSELRANEVNKEVKKYGVKSLVIKCDISNEDEVKVMVDEIVDKFGKIDVLVNNAAVCIDSLYQDKNVDNFKKT